MISLQRMVNPSHIQAASVKGRLHWFRTRSGRRTVAFYAFTSPFWLGLIFLVLIPLVVSILVSFTNYDGLNLYTTMRFMGLENYKRVFSDSDALLSIPRTFRWTMLNVPLGLVIGFVLALLLNRDVKGRGIFRSIFYLPTLLPTVAVTVAWKIFLDGNFGLLNYIISYFRPNTVIHWLQDRAFVSLLGIGIWWGVGGNTVLLLAGLQDIPQEMIEAAQVDGANSWRVFWKIILPLMTPVIFFMLITGVIGSFQAFLIPVLLVTQPYVAIGAGRPPRDVYFFMVHVWRLLYVNQQYGRSAAMLWVMALIVGLLTLIVFKTSDFWVYTEGKEESR